MMKIEHYWPIEILEKVFPDRFGPNAGKGAAEGVREGAVGGRAYTVEPAKGGCSVIRLSTVRRPRVSTQTA